MNSRGVLFRESLVSHSNWVFKIEVGRIVGLIRLIPTVNKVETNLVAIALFNLELINDKVILEGAEGPEERARQACHHPEIVLS